MHFFRRHLIIATTAIGAFLGFGVPAAFGAFSSPPPVHQVALAQAPAQPPMAVVGGCLGTPVLLGTIDFTNSSKTQATATTPFNTAGNGLAGKVLLVQSVTAAAGVVLNFCTSSTCTAAATTSVEIQPKERVCFYMHPSYTHIAALRSGSTSGNLLVWEMLQ